MPPEGAMTEDADSIQALTRKIAIFWNGHFFITIHRLDQPFLEDLRLLFRAAEAGEQFDAYRPVGETIAEIVIVLLSQQGGRHQHRHLLVVFHRKEGGAHRHFGFTEADVAAD